MEFELEVKHLAPYLPYGLKLQYIVMDKLISTGIMRRISHYPAETHPTRIDIGYQGEEHIWMFKPLLRPLREISGEGIVRLKLFVQADLEYLIDNPLNCSYDDIQYLLSQHFDVFDLISKGLATEIID